MGVTIRPVTPKDWEFILDLRNQSYVRLACHDTSEIDVETHRKYMEGLEKDPRAYQWIVSCDGYDVGHVKIISGELGYMLKREYHGKGIGAKFHDLVFEEAKKKGLRKLIDTIKVDNISSLKLAIRMGFREMELHYKYGEPYAHILERDLK